MAAPEREMTGLIAAGIAGYALAMELMAKLEDLKLLSRNDGANVIDAALASLERTHTDNSHPAFRIARQMLDAQLRLWQQDRPRGD